MSVDAQLQQAIQGKEKELHLLSSLASVIAAQEKCLSSTQGLPGHGTLTELIRLKEAEIAVYDGLLSALPTQEMKLATLGDAFHKNTDEALADAHAYVKNANPRDAGEAREFLATAQGKITTFLQGLPAHKAVSANTVVAELQNLLNFLGTGSAGRPVLTEIVHILNTPSEMTKFVTHTVKQDNEAKIPTAVNALSAFAEVVSIAASARFNSANAGKAGALKTLEDYLSHFKTAYAQLQAA